MKRLLESLGGLVLLLVGTMLVLGWYALVDRVGEWVESALRHLFSR